MKSSLDFRFSPDSRFCRIRCRSTVSEVRLGESLRRNVFLPPTFADKPAKRSRNRRSGNIVCVCLGTTPPFPGKMRRDEAMMMSNCCNGRLRRMPAVASGIVGVRKVLGGVLAIFLAVSSNSSTTSSSPARAQAQGPCLDGAKFIF